MQINNTPPITPSLYGVNGLCQSLPLITSPHSISKLLADLEFLPDENKLRFLSEFLELLNKCPCNSLILVQKNTSIYFKSQENFDLILYLIRTIMSTSTKTEFNNKLHDVWIKLFKTLLDFASPSRRYYEEVYEVIASVMSSCCKEGDVIKNSSVIFSAIEVLERLATPRQIPANEPTSYLYFISENCKLAVTIPPKTSWPFHKGFTIMMRIKPDNYGLLDDVSQLIFRIRSSTTVIECSIKNYDILYKIQSDSAHLDIIIPIGKLQKSHWEFFSISHNINSCLSVFIGFEERQFTVEYPKFATDTEFIEETFFEGFSGMANSVIVYKDFLQPLDIKSIIAGLPAGIFCDKHVQILNALDIPNRYNAWILFKPQITLVKNVFEESEINSAKLIGNSGCYTTENTSYIDTVKNIVPFFQLATLLDTPLAQKLLNATLNLSSLFLKPLLCEPYLAFRFDKESKCFTRILGLHLLHLNPKVVNEATIRCLVKLIELSPILQKRLLKMIMTSINFWINIPTSLTSIFWETIKAKFVFTDEKHLKIINVPILLDIMECINNSLEGSSCCNNHSSRSIPVYHSLNELYGSIKSFLKFFINNSSENNFHNLNHILHLLHKKPCPCLYYNLISLLKEISELHATYAKILYSSGELYTIFNEVRAYPIDIKIICIELTDVVIDQLKDTIDMKKFYHEFANICKDPNTQKSSIEENKEEIKIHHATTVLLTPAPRLSMIPAKRDTQQHLLRVNSAELLGNPKEKTEKKAFSCKLKADNTQRNIIEEDKASPLLVKRMDHKASHVDNLRCSFLRESNSSFLLFDHLSESRIFSQLNESIVATETLTNDTTAETLYSSIFLWLIGTRPSQVLVVNNRVPLVTIGAKPRIENPQILTLLVTLVKTFNKESLNRKCLVDLSILAESNEYNKRMMFGCERLLKWLLYFEAHWYKKLINYHYGNQYGAEMLKIAFILHLSVLCEGLQHSESKENITKLFTFYIHMLQKKTEHKKHNVVTILQCLKYVWSKVMKIMLLPIQGCISIDQIQPLIKITLNLILGINLKRDCDIKLLKKIRLLNINCNTDDPLLQFHVPDDQLVEHIIEAMILTYKYDGRPLSSSALKELCKEQVLDDHIRLLEQRQKKNIQFLGKEDKYTNYTIALLGLAFKYVLVENAGKMCKSVEQLGHYIGLLAEYASKKGYRRLASNEMKNFLLIISILLHECTNEERMSTKSYAKEIVKVISSLLMYAFRTAEELNGMMKELIKKAFGNNKHKNRILIENISQNSDKDNSGLDTEYKMIYEDTKLFSTSFSRISDTSLDILRNDLKNENRVMIDSALKKVMKPKTQQYHI